MRSLYIVALYQRVELLRMIEKPLYSGVISESGVVKDEKPLYSGVISESGVVKDEKPLCSGVISESGVVKDD